VPNYRELFLPKKEPYKKRFLVKTNNNLTPIEVTAIAYFFSEDKITFIVLKSGKKFPIDDSLKKLEDILDPTEFFRINRKYIIHIKAIVKMYYSAKSKIMLHIEPTVNEQVSVAIEKLGKFKNWLSI
ncbi:MAG: LytTR family DNA-binding domain-containing protein, partial [Bacteroidota bacterium]